MADRSTARRLESEGPRPRRQVARTTPAAPLELDRLIHERMRLAIVSALAVSPALSFNELKEIVGATDGNLSVHARKLEEAGYLTCTKSFQGRVPHTTYALSSRGREALERYLAHMEGLIRMIDKEGR